MLDLAPRMTRFKASESTEAGTRARQLRAEGHHVIDFSIGEPDFPVPDNVKAAISKALEADETHYTNTGGTPALLDAIRAKFSRENGLTYARDEVMVAAGAKQVMYNAFMATIAASDEVIVPRPYWISYPNQVSIAGGTPVIVDCDAHFRCPVEAIERAITPRTRWLVLNSPNNPSGTVLSRDDLRAIADLILKHPSILVMSDEIYEHLLYAGAEHVSIASLEPSLRERTLVVNGVSKAYAMTGLRIGYAGGPAPLIKEMVKLQSQTTSCASSLSQAAAIEALNGPQEIVSERRDIMERRRDFFVERLSRVQELRIRKPDGAMYLFCDCRSVMGHRTASGTTIASDTDFARYLLETYKVVVVPGGAYGHPGFFRISFATSLENIEEGCDRIAAACASLHTGDRTAAQ